jgi:hypothetical protein
MSKFEARNNDQMFEDQMTKVQARSSSFPSCTWARALSLKLSFNRAVRPRDEVQLRRQAAFPSATLERGDNWRREAIDYEHELRYRSAREIR